MQDDCLDVSNKPFYKRFYKRRKKLIPPPRGASFRAKKITLMLFLIFLFILLIFYSNKFMPKQRLTEIIIAHMALIIIMVAL